MRKLFAVALIACSGFAGVIGNWNNSRRSWNDYDFSYIKNAMTAAGHTVLPNAALSAANLAGVDMYIIAEPYGAPTAAELSALLNWLTGGGTLLLLADSDGFGVASLNSMTAALGSSITWVGSAHNPGTLAGGVFATDGPPYNIVGQVLNTTQGTAVSGGTALSGDYIRWQAIGSGYVFGFGDRSDHNYFYPYSTVNLHLFANLAAHPYGGGGGGGNGGGGGGGSVVPEPSTWVLLVGGLSLCALRLRRRN